MKECGAYLKVVKFVVAIHAGNGSNIGMKLIGNRAGEVNVAPFVVFKNLVQVGHDNTLFDLGHVIGFSGHALVNSEHVGEGFRSGLSTTNKLLEERSKLFDIPVDPVAS